MHSTIRKVLSWFTLLLLPAVTVAADISSNNHHIAGSDNPIGFSYVLQIIASFVAVIAFIIMLGWLMRKTGRFGAANNKTFRIVSSMSLGMREKIVLINVEGVNIVVGVAPGQIRTLHVLGNIPDKEDADRTKDSDRFGRIIENFMK